jgi:hypothetical protein
VKPPIEDTLKKKKKDRPPNKGQASEANHSIKALGFAPYGD